MNDLAHPAVERIRRQLPEAYPTVVEDLIDEARHDNRVAGLLLTGSLARGDALPGSDVDVRCIMRPNGSLVFSREIRHGVLVETSAVTEEAARAKLVEQPMNVYAYLDGVALFDPDGALVRLGSLAQQLVRDYRTTPSAKGELEEALGHPAEIGLRLLDWTRHELASP